MERTFTRMDTKAVKGVAVFCMVAHHLFYSESRRPIGMPEIHWTLDGMIAGMSLEDVYKRQEKCLAVPCQPHLRFVGRALAGALRRPINHDFRGKI